MGGRKTDIISRIAEKILCGDLQAGKNILLRQYPYRPIVVSHRSYTVKQKLKQFARDGFIDRYSGERLVHPGMLKVLSFHYPEDFPYHPHWKTSESHIAYWELSPTIDHVLPIASGGKDEPANWATTSMMRNAVKSNWTLEQLQWRLHPPGNIADWDGLTATFLDIVRQNSALLGDAYIKKWYMASMDA